MDRLPRHTIVTSTPGGTRCSVCGRQNPAPKAACGLAATTFRPWVGSQLAREQRELDAQIDPMEATR